MRRRLAGGGGAAFLTRVNVSDHRRARAALWLPALIAVLVYLPSLANGFALDDVAVIAGNDLLHGFSHLPRALVSPYWPDLARLYRPATTLLFSVEWNLGGGSPLPFHVVSLALHALATLLVTRLVADATTLSGGSLAGALFAIHPVHAEAVSNVVGQSDLLCAIFLVAAMLATPSGTANAGTAAAKPWLRVALYSALAFAAKETGIVAPALVWCVAWMRRPQGAGRGVATWPMASLAGVLPLIALRLGVLRTLAGDRPHAAFETASGFVEQVAARATGLAATWRMLVIPSWPRIDYSPPADALQHPDPAIIALGILALVAGLAALAWHWRRPSPGSLGAAIATLCYFPVSNLLVPTGVVAAERTVYAASIGAMALFAWPALRLAGRARNAILVALAGWGLVGTSITLRSQRNWRDTESVSRAMLRYAPESYRTFLIAARLRLFYGDVPRAVSYYRRTVGLFDRDHEAMYEAGSSARREGLDAEARAWLSRALALSPSDRRARTALMQLMIHQGDAAGAAALAREGLTREPDQQRWRAVLDSLATRPPRP